MICTVGQSFELRFLIELWNVYQWARDHMPGTNNSVERFYEAMQSSVINMHPDIWKLIPPLRKEDTLPKKKQCGAEWEELRGKSQN